MPRLVDFHHRIALEVSGKVSKETICLRSSFNAKTALNAQTMLSGQFKKRKINYILFCTLAGCQRFSTKLCRTKREPSATWTSLNFVNLRQDYFKKTTEKQLAESSSARKPERVENTGKTFDGSFEAKKWSEAWFTWRNQINIVWTIAQQLVVLLLVPFNVKAWSGQPRIAWEEERSVITPRWSWTCFWRSGKTLSCEKEVWSYHKEQETGHGENPIKCVMDPRKPTLKPFGLRMAKLLCILIASALLVGALAKDVTSLLSIHCPT